MLNFVVVDVVVEMGFSLRAFPLLPNSLLRDVAGASYPYDCWNSAIVEHEGAVFLTKNLAYFGGSFAALLTINASMVHVILCMAASSHK